jgi:hypothetical protein
MRRLEQSIWGCTYPSQPVVLVLPPTRGAIPQWNSTPASNSEVYGGCIYLPSVKEKITASFFNVTDADIPRGGRP